MSMDRQTPLSPAHPLSRWASLEAPGTIAVASALFLAVTAVRVAGPSTSDVAGTLYVLPIAVLALGFGLRGGLLGGLLGLALIVGGDLHDHYSSALVVQSVLYRTIAFVLLGVLLGIFVDRRLGLEKQIRSYYEESLDLLATSDVNGRVTRLNPAWEGTLGHSTETMLSRPFIDFVHPDDLEATLAELGPLIAGESATVGFRNRYRAADGSYRWLEWSAVRSPSESVIHSAARDVTVQHNAELAVAERTVELELAHAETLQRLALAAEYRDDDTYQHTERVGIVAEQIGKALGLGAEETRLLGEAAPLHDVGKLATPDAILLKAGALTAQEREIMKSHAASGAHLLSGSGSSVLQMATVIAASHHERWDGTGYPLGLAGDAIPLVGRVTAVADVFDALTHDRPYKSAWTPEQAIAEIRRSSGTQFDPRVVTAFLSTPEPGSGRPRSSRLRPADGELARSAVAPFSGS
jgi:putative two-component system response regulator